MSFSRSDLQLVVAYLREVQIHYPDRKTFDIASIPHFLKVAQETALAIPANRPIATGFTPEQLEKIARSMQESSRLDLPTIGKKIQEIRRTEEKVAKLKAEATGLIDAVVYSHSTMKPEEFTQEEKDSVSDFITHSIFQSDFLLQKNGDQFKFGFMKEGSSLNDRITNPHCVVVYVADKQDRMKGYHYELYVSRTGDAEAAVTPIITSEEIREILTRIRENKSNNRKEPSQFSDQSLIDYITTFLSTTDAHSTIEKLEQVKKMLPKGKVYKSSERPSCQRSVANSNSKTI